MDKYDEQIKKYKDIENPEQQRQQISNDWTKAMGLFQFVIDKRYKIEGPNDYGCLTLIRAGEHFAYRGGNKDYELTRQIREDERIPKEHTDIDLDNVHIFAEWQRKLDEEIRGEVTI